MFDFTKQKVNPIGLDIGFDSVRMLQLQSHAGKVSVVAADEVLLDSELISTDQIRRELTISAIKDILARGYFNTNQVISSLPSSDLIIKSLRVDSCDEKEIEKLLQTDIIERCGLKNETHEIRFITAGSIRHGSETKNEIIIFAAEKEALKNHISMLEEAGIEPVGIEAIPCALYRSLQRSLRRGEDKDKASVFVDVGQNRTTVIIGKAGEIIFAKQIDIASEQINNEIASKLGIEPEDALHLRTKLRNSDEAEDIAAATRHVVIDSMNTVIDALAKEISLCLRYYSVTFRGQRPSRVVFAGGESYEKTLINALKRHLEIEIEVTEPLRGFDLSKVEFPGDKRGMLCEWAVASGLSMKNICADNLEKEGAHERN